MDTPHNNENTQTNRLIKLGMRLGISSALHPIEYSKVLIQVRMVWHGLDQMQTQNKLCQWSPAILLIVRNAFISS